MKLVIQYVTTASVQVNEQTVGQIGRGYAILVGIGQSDNQSTLESIAHKLLSLRAIPDDDQKLNQSIQDIKGEILLIPQFTLMGRLNGHRPGYTDAAKPKKAKKFFDQFTKIVKEKSSLKVETGQFGATMTCSIINLGPVTYILE